MRQDEEECKAAFQNFLAKTPDSANHEWAPGNEPPDCYLLINRTKYAVEITTAMEQINLENKTISELTFLNTVRRFLKEIEHEAILAGILTGAYSVTFKPIDNFRRSKQQIKRNITSYLRSTQNNLSAPAETIIGRGHSSWEIVKRHSDRTYLSGSTTDGKWRGEAYRELSTLVDRILITKSEKLSAISKPWILLIANRYPWLENSDWHSSITSLKSIDEFHTVFLTSRDRGTYVLHSENADWSQSEV
jgi:hypothetical protein